jgi:serine phosphatase RsbU (regulator of sigma subunit)
VAVLGERLRITGGQTAPFEAGGDFYEVATDARGCVSIILTDVCGNGPAAGAFVPALRAVAREQLVHERSPAIVLGALNQWLARAAHAPDRFATALALRIDPRSGSVELASAGHLGPFLKTARGSVRAFPLAIGVALGICPAERYVETTINLASGDGLILATDGVTDALASAGDALGQVGLLERLRLESPGDGAAICAMLLRHARAREDATVLVV